MITAENWVPDGTEVRRAREKGVTTTTVIELDTGDALLTITEDESVVTGELVRDPEPGLA